MESHEIFNKYINKTSQVSLHEKQHETPTIKTNTVKIYEKNIFSTHNSCQNQRHVYKMQYSQKQP